MVVYITTENFAHQRLGKVKIEESINIKKKLELAIFLFD